MQPFIQIDFLLKRNSAPTTRMLQPRGDNAMHSTAVYSAESPGIKTHTYLPSYTHNIFHLPLNTQALPPPVPTPICLSPFSSYLHCLHLHLQAVTWLPQAGGGCQAANSGKPYMEDHPPLPNASPCKLANCLKLREPPKTVQRRGVCANWLKSSAGCSSITFHMREPSVLIKPPPASPPRLPIHLSRHPIPPIPPHLQRKSVMFQVNRVSALWEIFYRRTNRVIVCHMLDIALHRVSCPS